MKLILKQLDNPLSGRLLARRVRIPCFDEQWHYHPELELIYLIKSRGVRFLGDHIDDFSDNELVLTGSNLPHLWRNDPQYYLTKKKDCVDVIIIQFREDFMGTDFINSKEASRIKELFSLSKQGILFTGDDKTQAIKLIRKLPDKTGVEQLLDLLMILNLLSNAKKPQLISGPYFQSPFRESEHDRINNVSRYLMDHFQENISLEKVASIANMSPNAFCRYFKKRTNRTLVQLLNEIRISHACKMIMHQKRKISEISVSCGFKSVTLFNRQFKQIMKMNPRKYRNLHQFGQK
jgi:AraC-like DNA-binding protein